MTIEERPTVKEVEFSGNKKFSNTQLKDHLKEAKLEIRVGAPLSLREIAKITGEKDADLFGFCMGGTAAFLAACRLPGFSAAVAFYGGMIGKFADEKPKCPLQMHFGESDHAIPLAERQILRRNAPHLVRVLPFLLPVFTRDGLLPGKLALRAVGRLFGSAAEARARFDAAFDGRFA